MHVPVTALDTVLVNERRVLLIGQGPHLRVYDCTSHELLASRRVFDVQPIHHIACLSGIPGPVVIVAGRRHVVKIALDTTHNEGLVIKEISKSQIDAKEWVLKVHSHNEDFLGLTTNNVLLKVGDSSIESDLRAVGRLAEGPGASLYSGDFCTIDAGKLLVAAGSVFGEVLIWTCQRLDDVQDEWITATTHRFEGHTGSVFGVRISPEYVWGGKSARFVLSCSDDRTVQLWDVSHHDESSGAADKSDEINTGFGQDSTDSRYRVAMGWGHQSRIWDVDFLGFHVSDEKKGQLHIATRGEDGTSQYWAVKMPERDAEDRTREKALPYASDRHHSGKNLWAWTKYWSRDTLHVVTGGADGRVVSRIVTRPAICREGVIDYSIPSKELRVAPNLSSLKEYAIVNGQDGHEILALASSGEIVKYCPRKSGPSQWEVAGGPGTFRINKICASPPPGLIIFTTDESLVVHLGPGNHLFAAHDVVTGQVVSSIQLAGSRSNGDRLSLCIIVTSMSGSASVVWLDGRPADNMTSGWHRLQLPDHFVVTSSHYDHITEILVLGSRAGAVAVMPKFGEHATEPGKLHCFRHVHGSDAVTSLQFLPVPAGSDKSYLLSTGRDGRYAVHCIEEAAETEHLAFTTVHCASPPFGPHIEGATVTTSPSGQHTELILHGFRSKQFVVWNETRQTDVFSVDCGGAHRSWMYLHDNAQHAHCGSFIWTKAGTFNLHSESQMGHRVIQEGGHGREIKALAVCLCTYSAQDLGLLDAPIIATGAEDTTIRIFAVRQAVPQSAPQPQFLQLCTMNDHTAGLQDLVFSLCGSFLFSCGGAEQLFAWRLSFDIPLIGIGSVLQDKMPQTDEDSDVRIMSISLSKRDAHDHAFHLAAAYSNGKVKLLSYTPSENAGKGLWNSQREVLFGSFCLMQVFTLTSPTTAQEAKPMLTAGTNGFINLTTYPESDGTKHRMDLHSVHQSSILAMDVVELGSGCWFVATGGDDNGLSLTTVSVPDRQNNTAATRFATVRIREAHAAALTAVKLLSVNNAGLEWRVRLATAGNDQRVIIWEAIISRGKTSSADDFQVVRLQHAWTAIADVSNIDLAGTSLLVAGVGIETIDLDSGLNHPGKIP